MTSSQTPNQRKIIHVDMDAFFASVEQRDKPQYKDKPLVVGGSPYQRGVVCAASYEARRYGIHSAMPSKTAFQRCPELIFVKPRFEVYREVSDQIREIFYRYTDLVEPLSLDEAYLDVTINKKGMPSATLIAKEIREKIWEETNLTASAGISVNKFLAKTATSVRKPNGIYLIPPAQAESYVESLPIEDFYGIGKATAKKMHDLGIYKGADLKRYTIDQLMTRFGKVGSFYYNICRGIDTRPVVADRIRKSIGAEESYAEDLADRQSIIEALGDITETLLRRLQKHHTSGRTLTLKVKYSDYQQATRSRTLSDYLKIDGPQQIIDIALDLLASTEISSRNARLLGLTVSNLECEEVEEAAALAEAEKNGDGGRVVQLKLELTSL
ncbi:MAG: DNA polymerase IV [Candidatus Obscuribacterales bacterium]|nr:DNA polymerase IV [Candidatus Obscuribacterales bacterium]